MSEERKDRKLEKIWKNRIIEQAEKREASCITRTIFNNMTPEYDNMTKHGKTRQDKGKRRVRK